MNRLIDADKLKRYIPTRMDMQDLYLPVHFKTLIDEQPTVDAVEVVRCRDCKLWQICNLCMRYGDDWFCAGGER